MVKAAILSLAAVTLIVLSVVISAGTTVSKASEPTATQYSAEKRQQVMQTVSAVVENSLNLPKPPATSWPAPPTPNLPSGEPQVSTSVVQVSVQAMDPKLGLPFYGANTMWQVGSVKDGPLWNYLYVFTLPGSNGTSAALGTWEIDGVGVNNPNDQMFTPPHSLSLLSITGVSGQGGLVSMKSNTGQVVTFDLASHKWTFEP